MTNSTDNTVVKVCSQNSDIPSYITFKNATSRKMDVYWVDFKGKYVKYLKNFSPGNVHHINTFVTHPWIARDSVTNDVLMFNGKSIFYPPAWNGEQSRNEIRIHVPVFNLKKRCIQVLKDYLTKNDIPSLEIPHTLIEEMCMRSNMTFREYERIIID
ncbi:hypothetical protein SNE40_002184 [Patella caerulea]|uniref:von Hippel-Lindau disease tumour suppressor beta domain-containing protein n=2 Tax=Patella caerulea TaxID=87958 RepID=A0AAN8Q762_PATCE